MSLLTIRNLPEFNQVIREFAVQVVPEKHLGLQKAIALELLKRIVMKTPVKTGRARGNWQVTTGAPSESATDEQDQVGNSTIGQGAHDLAAAQPFGVITIYNNVDYIEFLERGSSKQAPSGMVSVSLAEVQGAYTS